MEPDPGRGDPFDEERDAEGHLRPAYERVLEALAATDLEELRAAVERQLADNGVTFGDQPFVVDPVPRLIAAEEWASVERGLTQRTRALNHFLTDVYGERRIVSAGIVDAETIDGAEGYEPDLRDRLTGERPAGADHRL